MPDRNKKFHEFALKSILFKGRGDWYFCYLKTERIAHVLVLLAARNDSPTLKDIALLAQTLPADIARLAGGELSPAGVLSEVFALLSGVRLAATDGALSVENSSVLAREYEQVAERLMAGAHPSPFLGPEDFFTQEIGVASLALPKTEIQTPPPFKNTNGIKDTKGQPKGQSDRVSLILAYIRKQKSASIKEVAAIVPGCSEKTVQRELNSLIEQGLVRRVGERRWSMYEPS